MHEQEKEGPRRPPQEPGQTAAPARPDPRFSGPRLCRRGDPRRRAGPDQGRLVAAADGRPGRIRRRRASPMPAADPASASPRPGACAFTASGASSRPRTERLFRCAVRRLLKQLVTDSAQHCFDGRHRLASARRDGATRSRLSIPGDEMPEGLVERVEPRHGVLTRASRRRENTFWSPTSISS